MDSRTGIVFSARVDTVVANTGTDLGSHTALCAREKVQKLAEDLFSFSSLLLLMRAATFQARACVNIFCRVSSNGSPHTVTSGLD